MYKKSEDQPYTTHWGRRGGWINGVPVSGVGGSTTTFLALGVSGSAVYRGDWTDPSARLWYGEIHAFCIQTDEIEVSCHQVEDIHGVSSTDVRKLVSETGDPTTPIFHHPDSAILELARHGSHDTGFL